MVFCYFVIIILLLYMSTSKSPIIEKGIQHSVSPIRDVLVVPPGAVSYEESIRPHPALLVEQRTSQNTSTSPIVTSSASSANSNRTGLVAVAVKQSQSHKSHNSEKEKKKDKEKGKRKGTKRKGGGSRTRKKYNRKLRKTRGRKRQ